MDFECMKKIVEDRHSVRKFTGEPIEKGLMEEILGYALVFYGISFIFSVVLLQ